MKIFNRLVLRVWLSLKWFLSSVCGYRKYKVAEEIDFVQRSNINISELDYSRDGLYRDDKLFGLQFDWQKDTITTFIKGGDCNSLHRIIQVALHNRGQTSYLVTLWTKPFKNSHAFVLYQKNRLDGAIIWTIRDYKEEIELDTSFSVALAKLKEIYPKRDKSYTKDVKIEAMALQDIDFKIKKVV